MCSTDCRKEADTTDSRDIISYWLSSDENRQIRELGQWQRQPKRGQLHKIFQRHKCLHDSFDVGGKDMTRSVRAWLTGTIVVLLPDIEQPGRDNGLEEKSKIQNLF
jgi:hypothetical protein